MANVLSNLMISKTQILTFFNIIGARESQIDAVRQWVKFIAKVDKNGYISIQSFTEYINTYPGLLAPLDKIRGVLVRNIVGEKHYLDINQRKRWYEECILIGRDLIKPRERCFMALFRLLLTNEPHPFHYDFRQYIECKTYEECLAVIRKRYGYSNRPVRELAISISSHSTSFHQNCSSARSRFNSSNNHSVFHFTNENNHTSINSARNKNSNNVSKLFKSNRVVDGYISE